MTCSCKGFLPTRRGSYCECGHTSTTHPWGTYCVGPVCPDCGATDDAEFLGVRHEISAEYVCHACANRWSER